MDTWWLSSHGYNFQVHCRPLISNSIACWGNNCKSRYKTTVAAPRRAMEKYKYYLTAIPIKMYGPLLRPIDTKIVSDWSRIVYNLIYVSLVARHLSTPPERLFALQFIASLQLFPSASTSSVVVCVGCNVHLRTLYYHCTQIFFCSLFM